MDPVDTTPSGRLSLIRTLLQHLATSGQADEPWEGSMAIRPFGELESKIMRIVWRQEAPVTIHALTSALNGPRTPAYTTVMTVTERLREKGWLTRVKNGRSYQYSAARSADFYTAELMRQVLDASTDRERALRRFAARLDPREAAALRQALADPPSPAAGAHRSNG